MTAQQKPAPLNINAFNIKEISARMQQRATEINLHLPLSASLELAASVFGYNNYHEVAPSLKGQASLNIAGVNITGQMIEAVFAAYEKATGSKQVNLVVPASDPGGDFSYVVIKLDSSSFLWMLEQQISGQTRQFEPTAIYPSYAWRSEISGSFDENPVQSFFYSTAHHKHDDGGGDAVSSLISSHRCFAEILFVLAQDYDSKQITGLDRNELSKIVYTTNEIRFAGNDVEALEFLVDSADFAQIDENLTSLVYGDGHTLPAHTIFYVRNGLDRTLARAHILSTEESETPEQKEAEDGLSELNNASEKKIDQEVVIFGLNRTRTTEIHSERDLKMIKAQKDEIQKDRARVASDLSKQSKK